LGWHQPTSVMNQKAEERQVEPDIEAKPAMLVDELMRR
jgi:hypothetical protein